MNTSIYEHKHGFIHQVYPYFDYSEEYENKQATTESMAKLRMDYLEEVIGHPYGPILEMGTGTGVQLRYMKERYPGESVRGYDLKDSDVCPEELIIMQWPILMLFDVLEHFLEIDSLWEVDFEVGMFSFPECPTLEVDADEFKEWRHRKPNQHLWHLNLKAFGKWVDKHGYDVIDSSNVEDAIRTPWSPDKPNITTCIIRRR